MTNTTFTLGQAARLAGVGKTTIARAIKGGRLSATRRDDGSYAIDGAELARAYDVRPETPETVTTTRPVERDATPRETPGETPAVRLAVLEADVKALREMVDELRQARDDWKAQAERATIALAAPSRPWWKRLAG